MMPQLPERKNMCYVKYLAQWKKRRWDRNCFVVGVFILV